MDCPKGQVYWAEGKRCIRPEALPGAKGKSLSACAPGKVWLPAARKCVSKAIYEKHYGKANLDVALKKQMALGQRSVKRRTVKVKTPIRRKTPVRPKTPVRRKTPVRQKTPVRPKTPVKPRSITPRIKTPVVSPAIRKTVELDTSTPRKDSYMPPGLTLKRDMVTWIADKCSNQTDPISMEPYDTMLKNDLKTVVRLGNSYCYLADDLDKHIKSSVERDLPLKNISNPWYRIDSSDLGALKHQELARNSTYKLPSKNTEMPAEHYKLYIDVVDESPFKYIFLYDERKIVEVDDGQNYSPAIPRGGFLGYIPEFDSEKLTGLIKKAFAQGRLFTKVRRPFECCRFHLKKPKSYWDADTKRKIAAMEEEIEAIV
jgi:hypothetical protein